MQIADLLDDGGGEIVFRTYHGHLVIMDKNLTIRYEHAEGGILDLALGPAPPREAGWLKRPIYLLSVRGHVVRLEIDGANSNDGGMLAGASGLQYGGLRDLDIVTYQGQQQLAVLCMPHNGATDAVRFFSATDCSKIGEFGNLEQPPLPPEEGDEPATIAQTIGGDPAFCFVDGHGSPRYAIWSGSQVSVWDGNVPLGLKNLSSFLPAGGDAAIAAGDIDPDPASPGHEIVVATKVGRLVWLKLSDLLGVHDPDLHLSRTFVTQGGRVYEDRCNTSLSATWAMAAEPASGSTPAKLRVIDPAGTWLDVDPVTGNPTKVSQLFFVGPSRGLVPARAPNGLTIGSGGQQEGEWQTETFGAQTWLRSRPYVPNVQPNPPTPWSLPAGITRPLVEFEAGHWVFRGTGAVYVDTVPEPDRVWCAWWAAAGNFYDLIQRATYDLPQPMAQATITTIRGSTQGVYQGGQPPPRWPTGSTGFKPLRTELGNVPQNGLQGIAIGKVMASETDPQIVASALGGRVLLLSGTNCQLIAESKDYGLGGMALAVGNLDADPQDEIVFAPVYSPMPHTGQKVRSYLHVLDGSTPGTLTEVGAPVPVGDLNSDDFLGWGACGIAIADVPPHGKLIFVATLNGELAVFRPLASGAIDPNPVFRRVLEGAIGAFGSIVVADLVPDPPPLSKPELYLGGSSGVRRFDFQ